MNSVPHFPRNRLGFLLVLSFMDTGSPVGASGPEDVNRSDGWRQLTSPKSLCICHIPEDISLNELGEDLKELLHIQDHQDLASHSTFSHLSGKADACNVKKKDDKEDTDEVESSMIVSEKRIAKCATFPCSSKKASLAASTDEEDDITTPVLAKNGYESVKPECPRSTSLPTPLKLVSAMKGSREKQGTPLQKLTVTWAPDVYDPTPSTLTIVRNKKPRSKNESKKNGKNKQKSKSPKGGSSKDKKKARRYSGNSNKCYQWLDGNDRVPDRNDPCGELAAFDVGSPNAYCGSSFLKKSVADVHFSIAEAT